MVPAAFYFLAEISARTQYWKNAKLVCIRILPQARGRHDKPYKCVRIDLFGSGIGTGMRIGASCCV